MFVLTTSCTGRLIPPGPPAASNAGEAMEQVASLEAQAMALWKEGAFAEMVPVLARIVDIYRAHLSPDDPRIPKAQADLAELLFESGEHDRAAELFEAAVADTEALLGADHPALARTLGHQGQLLQAMGRYDDAMRVLERSLEIREAAFGPDHPDVAISLNDLGLLHQELGNFPRAQEQFERALGIRERATPPDPRLLANSLSNLAYLLDDRGDFERARTLFDRSLSLKRDFLPADHPSLAVTLNNQGMLLRDLGDYRAARPLLEEAVSIFEGKLGPDHADTATVINNVGLLLVDMGDYAVAQVHLERALDIRENALEPGHSYIAMSLNNLAHLHFHEGNLERAREFYERALVMREQALGPEHSKVAKGCHNLAKTVHAQGDQERALALYHRSLDLYVASLGDEHPDVATVLSNLGALHMQRGDYDASEDAYQRSLGLRVAALGEHHPSVAESLFGLALVDHLSGDTEAALRSSREGLDIVEQHLEPLLDATSERERMALMAAARQTLDGYLSLSAGTGDAVVGYEAVLRWKGIVGRSLLAQRGGWALDEETAGRFERLGQVRRFLASELFVKTPVEDPHAHQERIRSLTEEKEVIERELAERSQAYRQGRSLLDADWRSVAGSLADGMVVVDFLRYRRLAGVDDQGGPVFQLSYLAFMTTGGAEPSVRRVELGPAADIEQAIAEYREAIGQVMRQGGSPRPRLTEPEDGASRGARVRHEDGESSPGGAVRRMESAGARVRGLIWEPLEGDLADVGHVLLVPDGAVSEISFAGLQASSAGTYLVEKYRLSYLGRAQDLLRPPLPETSSGAALVIGGVRYQGSEGEGTGSVDIPGPGMPTTRAAGCAGQHEWAFLPGTEQEAEAVARWLGASSPDHDVTLLTGPSATEWGLVEHVEGKRYVHLATHGFFAGGRCLSATEGSSASDPWWASESRSMGFNPMVLSGIVLAGANAPEDDRSTFDGILTAEEVATLNLAAAELVVLSACETGRGDIRAGEGVLGLRRAFSHAGARTLVMSLWEVPDAETMELMDLFYRRHREDGSSKAEALREAQLEMLRRGREAGEPGPQWWASFILSGGH